MTDPLIEAWRRWTESLTKPDRPTTGILARDAFAAGWDAAALLADTPSVEPKDRVLQAEALDQAYRRGWADREGRDRVFRVLDPDVPGPQETSYVLCQNCGGSGRNCPTCHGWGVEGPHRLCPECDAEGPA